jgi:competence protein ComFC
LCQGIVGEFALGVVCQDCWNKVKAIEDPFCAVCGYPFVSKNIEQGALCGSCRHQLFAFDFARSYSSFSDPLKEIIHQFKYGGHLSLARPLGRCLEAVYQSFPESFRSDVIIPVPLHKARERERGFNQAAELAKQLSRLTRIPFQSGWFVRARPTEVQAGLTRRQRRMNLKGAFQVSSSAVLANRSVLLLDDVFTTGATLNECATILKGSGCRLVNVLTIARVARD